MTQPVLFVGAARLQTKLRDFNRLREAIQSHDTFAIEEAWDKCERWLIQIEHEDTEEK